MTNRKTASDYRKRLELFRVFVLEKYNMSLDELILTLTTESHGPKIDVYKLLNDYVKYIQKEKNVSPLTLKLLLSTTRFFLETFDVEISPRKYKLKVRTPKVVKQEKEALSRQDVQTILNTCHNIRLKTYVLFLVSTGCRAVEALSIRLCDINWKNDPVTVFIRGEFTKTKKDHIVMLTSEMVQQLQAWIDYKHRNRSINYYDQINKKSNYVKVEPKINEEVLIFSHSYNTIYTPEGLYTNVLQSFEKILDRLGSKFAQYENSTKRRRKITFHSLRRYVRSTVSNLGYSDFAEKYILNHDTTSTYYRVPPKERIDIFKKIEPNLTYLDQSSIENKGRDLTTRLEIMEQKNVELTNNLNKIMEMIRENPKLAQVKPEVLTKKKLGKSEK
jgi:integrase